MNSINEKIFDLVKQGKSYTKSYLAKHGSIKLENNETDVDFYASYFGNDGYLNSSQISLICLEDAHVSVQLEDGWWISEYEMDISLIMDILSIIELQENENK